MAKNGTIDHDEARQLGRGYAAADRRNHASARGKTANLGVEESRAADFARMLDSLGRTIASPSMADNPPARLDNPPARQDVPAGKTAGSSFPVERDDAPDPDLERLSQEVVRDGQRLTPETVRHRELTCWTLRKLGWTQWKIAGHLAISQQAVSKILRRVDRRTLKQMERDVQLVKVKQASRIEELYEEAMWGWHNSKNDVQRTRKRRESTGGTEETTERRDGQPDPRFLDVAFRAIEAERKLWGLEGPGGNTINVAMLAQVVARCQSGEANADGLPRTIPR